MMEICCRNQKMVAQSYFSKRGGMMESLIYKIFLAQLLAFCEDDWYVGLKTKLKGQKMPVLNALRLLFTIILLLSLHLIIEAANLAILICLMDDYKIPKSVFIILLMFRQERQFNIISGEIQPYATQNYRSSSNMEKIRRFQQAEQTPPSKIDRLGHSKDRKQFQYAYDSAKTQNFLSQRKSLNFNPSMLNSVSTDYNIVTLHKQHPTSKIVNSNTYSQKLPEVNKKSPLTAHIQAGRLFALNYHPDYPQRMANREFNRKKNLCDDICENQKTYGMNYFRVLK